MDILTQIKIFFASVRLAISTLCLLALTSIIGTIIPQGQPQLWYVAKYGEKIATFFRILDIDHMYSSWWFCSLLTVLALNLIVCSCCRFPLTWQQIQQDNTTLTLERISSMTGAKIWHDLPKKTSFVTAREILSHHGWRGTSIVKNGGELYFSQKGRWSRLGVYLVHLSILIIFLGAGVGLRYGFRASVFISEGEGINTVYALDDRKPIPLDFTVHCSSFQIDFYPASINANMPKEYTSKLLILQNNATVLNKKVEVNSPLTYQGITFYQSSFQALNDFFIAIDKIGSHDNAKRIFLTPFQQEIQWEEEGLRFGILSTQSRGEQVTSEKLWIKAKDTPAQQIVFRDNSSKEITLGEKEYRITVKQRYATGLQATKDPGVWLVYLGCLMMLAGLYMAFFMSHQRIWLIWDTVQQQLVFAASSNKNRDALQRTVEQLYLEITAKIQQ